MTIMAKGSDALYSRVIELVDLVAKKVPGYIYDTYKNGELILEKGLPDYISSNYDKCETIRTLIKRDSPTVLENIYEPPTFQSNSTSISEDELTSLIGSELQRTIVSGLAGSGKSVFLKRLFRKSIQDGYTYYPIFFELRTIETGSKNGLLDEIYTSVSKFTENFTRKQFNFGLKNGLFFLMIDALDEAPIKKRAAIEREILDISRKYPKCPLVITSRPSDQFSSWEGFHTAHLQPFSKNQCLSFIGKLDFPKERKDDFLKALKSGMFEKHRGFLSNPLLATMMLLTFDEYGEIPAKRHVFFDKCFQVLLREHDVNKGSYRRQFKSSLDYDELEEVFMYFCVFSYLDRKFLFSKNDLENYIADATEAADVKSTTEEIEFDLVNSISILQKDGDQFEFTHRSFQEFFYAKFAVGDREHNLIEKIEEIPDLTLFDDAVAMIADMDRSYFEQSFVLPLIKKIKQKTKNLDISERPDLLIKFFWARTGVKNKIREEDSIETRHPQLSVYYSVRHNEKEYPPRRLYLVLLGYLDRYEMGAPECPTRANVPDEEVLKLFGETNYPGKNQRFEIPVHHTNREKLIKLGAGDYATQIQTRLDAVQSHIQSTLASRKSKLSQKLKKRKP